MVSPERRSFFLFLASFPSARQIARGPQRPRPLGASERSDPGRTGPNELTQATFLTQTRTIWRVPTMF